jgi:hypothetical protein
VALRALENNAVALELLEHEPQTRQKFSLGRGEHYDIVDEDVADDSDEALQNHFCRSTLKPGGSVRQTKGNTQEAVLAKGRDER